MDAFLAGQLCTPPLRVLVLSCRIHHSTALSAISILSVFVKVADLQKKIAAATARLKQQQNLYEAVRSDRNVYSKNLIETQASCKNFLDRRPPFSESQ